MRTYHLEVTDVGTFEVRRRVMRSAVAAEVEYARLTQGVTLDPDTATFFRILAYLKAMIVSGPSGWDVDAVDPDDPEAVGRLQEVYIAIKAEEDRFRRGGKPDVAPKGEGAE